MQDRFMRVRGFHKVDSLFSRSLKPKDDKDKSRSFKKHHVEDWDTLHKTCDCGIGDGKSSGYTRVIEEFVNVALDSSLDSDDMKDEIDEEVHRVLTAIAGDTPASRSHRDQERIVVEAGGLASLLETGAIANIAMNGLSSSSSLFRAFNVCVRTNHSKSGLGLPSIVALVMVIDKSWTSLGKHEKAFYTGLKKFVDDCKPLVDSAGNIRCPCKSCRLVLWVSIKHLSDHISKYGFDPSYKTWIHHGEPDLPPPPPVIDNTRQPQMSDMTACLNDLSYIPLNNEQNEPTQGDIGETSNDPTQAKRNEFEELYASANEELYPGCDHVTRLDFMAKFTYFKVKGKLTDSIFNEMLEFFQNVFPTAKGYKLPPSYYAIKKTFKTIGLGYESIHACVNDCFLFRGDANKDVHFCPVCNTSRWKDSNTPGKKVPKKVLRYFPIIPRLQRLYKSSHTAKEMTWHATGKCTEPGKMQHPVDGRAWKDFDTKYLDFAAEPRNVRLGLAADGFNPFGNLSQSYSMWPVILTTYNLPPWLCMKESSFMLTLLIPGPKSPGKDIDVYLRPLIDDLKVLWAKPGVETIDVATGLKFNMRAMVLWTINDFPARSSLSGWSGQGYKACPTCNEDTPSVRVLGKTAYVGHRRFLKKPHKWRRSLEFNGETENGDPPREFSRDAIMTQLARLPTRVKGKHPRFGGVKIKRNVLVELNWTKRSIFYELEYWSFHTLKHNLDVMHIEKNVLESILNTLLMNDKSKDTAKARQDLKSLGIRSGLWLGQNKNGKCSKPQAAYSFTPADRKKFCQFIKGVKLPDGFGSNFKHKVTDNDTNITGLKSHDCHIMMQRLLPYGLQQYLPPDVAKPLIELCLFFKQICSQTLMVDDMLKAQSKVIDILCNLELIYPPAFFDIMIHLVIHLPLEAIFGGPIRPRWMYPFERYMKKLKNYVRNKAKPEGSIAEGYVAEEALTFSSHYFRDVTTKFNRPDRNVDCPPPTCQFQVFKSLCKSIGLRSVIRIDHQELKKVIWYVLHNSPEIDTYRAKFKIEFPNKDMKEEFPGWFGKQIRQRHVDNDPGVNESSELFALACGPSQTPISVNSCVVNGVRFVVHSRDERRTTQNSGICSPGPDEEMYYGQLEQILKFSYLSFKTVLFRVNASDAARPLHISEVDLDAQLAFWNDPKNLARAAQNKQNRAKSKMETSATREYMSLIHTFFLTHTVGGVFLNPEDKALYGLGSNTPTGVPYTEDEIMAIVREGKQRGHIPGVGRVLPGQGTVIPPPSQSTHSTDIARLKKREKQLTKQVNMFMSESGGCGDDEPGDDEDVGEDEDDSKGILGIPFELFRSTYPGRHVARETYPQRQVTQDTLDLSLGNIVNVVVNSYDVCSEGCLRKTS
ncbi:zinc finger, PHD-type containing protein [Tanacetum coccineum]